MKLLVIGHSVADVIIRPGESRLQPGGLFYSASTIREIASDNDELFLCTQIDKNHFNLFENVYNSFNLSLSEEVNSIPLVELKVDGNSERHEHYKNISSRLNINFAELYEFDGILINMVTGFDIDLLQMKELRKRSDSTIYFDVHTLTRGIDDNMNREFRTIPDFNSWAANIDILQCNERELLYLSNNNNPDEIINEMFECGIQILCLTKGINGVRIYYKHKDEITSYFRATKNRSMNNSVGLGDAFGAAFFYSYISHKNIFKAADTGASAAEFTASINNLSDFSRLKSNVFQ